MSKKYRVTEVAHNNNFFINPDRVIFEAVQMDNVDDWAFAKECQKIAETITNITAPFEMWFKEV